jgi:hypothetical protein
MSEVLLVAIFAGAAEGTTSTVFEHRRRHLFGGQRTHPYESRPASSSPSRTGANFLPDGAESRGHHAARSIQPLFTSSAALANT